MVATLLAFESPYFDLLCDHFLLLEFLSTFVCTTTNASAHQDLGRPLKSLQIILGFVAVVWQITSSKYLLFTVALVGGCSGLVPLSKGRRYRDSTFSVPRSGLEVAPATDSFFPPSLEIHFELLRFLNHINLRAL